ncbi:MAG: DNA-binding domain-containing protein [Spirochaetia bacterium]|nr:DNA-binding domain-containing protein [Spirochaetia bacterium]
MNLRDIQESFEALILEARSSTPVAVSAAVSSEILPGGTLAAKDSLLVYSRAYLFRLTEALGETYEAVWRLLGDDDFFEAAANYIALNPSRSHNLSHYGKDFPEFLRTTFPKTEILHDLAKFESKFAELFHKREETGLEPSELVTLTPTASLEFVDSLFFLTAVGPIYAIWKLREHPEPPDIDFTESESVIACKKNGQIFIRESVPGEVQLASLLLEGHSVADSLGRATITPEQVESFFSFIAQARLIRRIIREPV